MVLATIAVSFLTVASVVEAVNFTLNGIGTESINANSPFTEAFVSYSIEFASFPDFAGKTSPGFVLSRQVK